MGGVRVLYRKASGGERSELPRAMNIPVFTLAMNILVLPLAMNIIALPLPLKVLQSTSLVA